MSCAFLVHPRADLRRDLARHWAPLGLLPSAVYDRALRDHAFRSRTMASISLDGRPHGHLVLVPYGARHLLRDPRTGVQRISAALDHAAGLGAHVVGLGGLTAPVSAGGNAFRARADVGVTNGNAYTASVVHRQVRELVRDAPVGRVGVVGASGSVGAAVTRLLARDRDAAELVLVARGSARIEALKTEIDSRLPVRTGLDLGAIAGCDVVVLLTAAADTVLRAEHLAPGAAVLDATQPRNTSPDLLRQRPDIRLFDGGVVAIPSLVLRGGDIGLPAGQAFACLAETILLSLDGHRGHFSLGHPSLERVAQIEDIANRYAHLGFGPAPLQTFGKPLQPPPGPDGTADPTLAVAS